MIVLFFRMLYNMFEERGEAARKRRRLIALMYASGAACEAGRDYK